MSGTSHKTDCVFRYAKHINDNKKEVTRIQLPLDFVRIKQTLLDLMSGIKNCLITERSVPLSKL